MVRNSLLSKFVLFRFKSSMFDDHMPWAYNGIFKNLGTDPSAAMPLHTLDMFMGTRTDDTESNALPETETEAGIETQTGAATETINSGKLYPDLSTL